ncbi:MAG TPA: tetratricopeptide repeat protein [Chthoniobacterales bacterium]|nr:tetratricopeptide repeat protein [Chthoniobacterales bacterium]
MKKAGLILLAALALCTASPALLAQAEDPSETFLKAYMTSQQGEKLEHENQFKAALAKYRFAGTLLEQLHKAHPDWQPAIVEYRGRKVSESILRVQDKTGTQESLAASQPATGPAVAPPQNPPPQVPVAKEKIVTASPPAASKPVPASTPNEVVIAQATKKLRDRVDQLETELQKSRTAMSTAETEKQSLNSRLDETRSKLDHAQGDMEKAKTAEKQVRDQLAQAQASLKKTADAGSKDNKAQAALKSEIAELKKTLSSAQQGRTTAEKERDDANSKVAAADQQRAASAKERDEANARASEADRKVTSATKERDDALAQLKGLKDTQQRVEVLVAENSDLKQKLADAEKTVREIGEDKPKKEKELADVRKQITDLQTQLANSQKQNKDYQTTVAQLRAQLDDASKQLEQVKLVGATPEETAKLTKENEMLRNIIVRERQEEARRDQAKKLMLAEFDKLQIKSETLTEQIQLLAQPVTRLTTDELALLRQPVISISDDNPGAVKASFTFAKNTAKPAVPSTAASSPAADESMSTDVPPQPAEYTIPAIFKPNVPPDVVDLAWQAKQSFDKGKYHTAEKIYQEILTKTPNNLYSLSNLGVVYFRTGKLKAAELTLKKAVTLSPHDEFTHTTLGIVYYRQAKFDSALTELTKSLGINPKSATAHNYLGITASQKGWQEAAEKELVEAIRENPNYADAHFNLAVIYATSSPPAREQAKEQYTLATRLGAQPDPSLEKLLH